MPSRTEMLRWKGGEEQRKEIEFVLRDLAAVKSKLQLTYRAKKSFALSHKETIVTRSGSTSDGVHGGRERGRNRGGG